MTPEEEHAELEAIFAAYTMKYRMCAVCYRYVLRATYDAHLTQVHGYECLEVASQEDGCDDVSSLD